MKNSLVFLGVLLAALPVSAAEPQLKYVVIVTRHGVRSPTWDVARLNQHSAEPWPEWGVPAGNLTAHGREAIKLMGGYYREWLSSQKLIRSKGCQDANRVFIYADKDQRTIETGRALAESMMPGCEVKVASRSGGESDALFAGTFTADPQRSAEAVQERMDPQILEHHAAAFHALQFILGNGSKMLIEPGADAMKGPFATGSTLSENLLLEYTDGMKSPGWGRLTQENLLQVLVIHAVYADLMRRTPYLARRGANLLTTILRSIEQASSGAAVGGALGPPGSKVLVVSAHDTNLSNLSGLLGLHWRLKGYQQDDTPPGGALIFSMWTSSSGDFVTLRYVAQSLDQMRNLGAGAPLSEDVAVPGCGGCGWGAFRVVVEGVVASASR